MKQKLIGLFVFFGIAFMGCNTVSNKRIIRLGHGLDVTHSVHQAMLKADEHLNEISEGKMRIQIYPNQQLGS